MCPSALRLTMKDSRLTKTILLLRLRQSSAGSTYSSIVPVLQWRLQRTASNPFEISLLNCLNTSKSSWISSAEILCADFTATRSCWFASLATKLSWRVDDKVFSCIRVFDFMKIIQLGAKGKNERVQDCSLLLERHIGDRDYSIYIYKLRTLNMPWKRGTYSWWNILHELMIFGNASTILVTSFPSLPSSTIYELGVHGLLNYRTAAIDDGRAQNSNGTISLTIHSAYFCQSHSSSSLRE